ncbi:MAG TPA: YdcF family protein [Candidatus Paceibacterota bacterium]|nr:YdcF family protein [Candidatus Paceibacterota bacterium]
MKFKGKLVNLIKLMVVTYNDLIDESDVVVCLEGDGYNRIEKTIELFRNGLAKNIVISGGFNSPPFCLHAEILAQEIIKRGIPKNKIILEKNSQNTYEQGLEVLKIVQEKKWNKIILVASHFHQPRAYLAFLKAMKDLKLKVHIFNAPAKDLLWFEKTDAGPTRIQLMEDELEKIKEYTKKGHLIEIKEALNYQKWQEKKLASKKSKK